VRIEGGRVFVQIDGSPRESLINALDREHRPAARQRHCHGDDARAYPGPLGRAFGGTAQPSLTLRMH
jgi:hypothetical protein